MIPDIIRTVMRAYPAIIPNLSADVWRILRAVSGYDGIRNTYWAVIYDAVHDYLTSNQPVTTFKNDMKKGMVDAFVQTAELGYEDAGAELPLDEDTLAWLGGEQSAELGHIDDLFSRLKAEWDGIDPIHEAFARADGYAAKLDGLYNEAVLRGSKNKVAYWRLGKTEKHCSTCLSLDGQGHRISWYIDHDYIPRKSGCALECGGWECDCSLEDRNGNEVTL